MIGLSKYDLEKSLNYMGINNLHEIKNLVDRVYKYRTACKNMIKSKGLDYYLNLPWTYKFEYNHKDKSYSASISELNICSGAPAESIDEAVEFIKYTLEVYINNALQKDYDILEPKGK